MKQYELLTVYKPNTDAEEVDKLVAKLSSAVEALQGKVESVDKMGRKKLAYEINKFKTGYYYLFVVEAKADAVKEFDRVARINESLLRHLVVKVED